jgi:hypothetical protein
MVKPEAEEEEEEENVTATATSNNDETVVVVSDEEIKKIVGFAIAQNPLVYKRLADI